MSDTQVLLAVIAGLLSIIIWKLSQIHETLRTP
jgi:hypothetical protein